MAVTGDELPPLRKLNGSETEQNRKGREGNGTMRTLINVVLVLFGSVVPVVAQDQSVSVPATVQDGNGSVVPATIQVVPVPMQDHRWIIGIGITILGAICVMYWRLEKKIEGVRTESENAHGVIGQNIKDSEDRVTASVKTDVDRLYNLVKDSEDRVTASVKTDVDRLYNLMIQKKDKDA